MDDITELGALRAEVERLLARALRSDGLHVAELARRDELHLAELERRDVRHDAELDRRDVAHVSESQRRDEVHTAELQRRDQLHVDEMAILAAAIQSRDTIGQAKGIIMVTMRCSADHAFQLLKEQSQQENRKIVEIAAEIVAHTERQRTR